MRYLACVDFSPTAEKVFAAARDRVRHGEGLLVVLHVAAPEPSFVGYDTPGGLLSREARTDELAEERRQLDEQVRALRLLGLEVADPILRIGPTVETILATADEVDADTIVIGRHRHGRLHDLLLGNTANEVVRSSTRPVLLVPPRADTPEL